MYARPVTFVPLPSAPVSQWNFANVWEAVAATHPDAVALAQGPTRRTWQQFERRADAVAAALVSAGLEKQAKVAQYLYNGPEYLESVFAAFKAGLVPINTNYRYTDAELRLPVGQRRRRGGRVPRSVFVAARWLAGSAAAHPDLAVGGRRQRALPSRGHAV